MPAESMGAESLIHRSPLIQQRRSERRACRLSVSVHAAHRDFHIRLENLSAGGIGFTLDTVLALKLGERLVLSDERLGNVACVVRWAAHPRYGAEFEAAGAALDRVHALYDSLAPAPGQRP